MSKLNKTVWGMFLWFLLISVMFAGLYWPLSQHKKVSIPYVNLSKDKTLVFFGFAACRDVCPVTMSELAKIFSNPDFSSQAEMLFIDIDKNSSAEVAQMYSQAFNSSFLSYHPSEAELAKLSQIFGLNIKEVENEILHVGRVYLIEKEGGEWYLIKSYNPNDFSLKQIKDDLIS